MRKEIKDVERGAGGGDEENRRGKEKIGTNQR